MNSRLNEGPEKVSLAEGVPYFVRPLPHTLASIYPAPEKVFFMLVKCFLMYEFF